ncbi:MAG: hydrogenase maturation protease [Cyclobacteriaceae bacterium]
MREAPKILIAGVGNELKQDDAFGIELARSLLKENGLSPNVKVMEVGIGGIHLVQELHEGYDVLVIADAVDYGGDPGQIYLRKLESIGDIEEMPTQEQRTFLADMHYTNPIRALMLAKALKVLPSQVMILGCEAQNHDDFAIGMSKKVIAAIPKAKEVINHWLLDNELINS